MKKLKLNLSNLPGTEILTREQMKKVVGGMYSGGNDGNCQERGQHCNSATALNCCSGLVCAEYVCRLKTR